MSFAGFAPFATLREIGVVPQARENREKALLARRMRPFTAKSLTCRPMVNRLGRWGRAAAHGSHSCPSADEHPETMKTTPHPHSPTPSSLSPGRGKRGRGDRVRGLGHDFQGSHSCPSADGRPETMKMPWHGHLAHAHGRDARATIFRAVIHARPLTGTRKP